MSKSTTEWPIEKSSNERRLPLGSSPFVPCPREFQYPTAYRYKDCYQLGGITTDCIVYFGTGSKEQAWDRSSVVTSLVGGDELWRPPEDVIKVKPWLIWEWEQTHQKYYEEIFRTNRAWIERADSHAPKLHMEFRKVSYEDVVATHWARNKCMAEVGQSHEVWSMRKRYGEPPKRADQLDLSHFGFANHCGVALTILTGDNKFLFTERSAETEGKGGLACVGETMKCGRDETTQNNRICPDPFLAATSGAKEELGIDINPEAVKLLSVFYNTEYCQITVDCLARIPEKSKEIEPNIKYARDSWEHGPGIYFFDNDPVTLGRELRQRDWTTWGKMSAIHSIIYENGFESTKHAFEES
jgi:hypothetical protein